MGKADVTRRFLRPEFYIYIYAVDRHYMSKLASPTAAEVLAIRKQAGLTQGQAAELVYAGSYRTWQDWERGVRKMPVSQFELFKLKLKL